MKKLYLIPALCAILINCGNRGVDRYGYTYGYSSAYYNSVYTPPVRTAYSTYRPYRYNYSLTPYYNYYQPYSYYGYNYPTYFSYYPYYNTYYYPYTGYRYYSPSWYRRTCSNEGLCRGQTSEMNLKFDYSGASDTRIIEGENLRAQTIGDKIEIEYRNEPDEKLNFFKDSKGKTFVSGKLLADGQLITINSNTQKCNSAKTKFEDDPSFEVAKFDCSDGHLKISAEVLIPEDQQNLAEPKPR